MLEILVNYLPALSTLSPLTVAGAGVMGLGSLLYLLTRTPEFLLVVLTAMLYAAVPLIPRLLGAA